MDPNTPLLKLECEDLDDVESTEDDSEVSNADNQEQSNVNINSGVNVVCKICKEKMISVKAFIGHYRIEHMGVKPYVCGKCNLGFDSVDLLKEHHWTHRKRKRAERFKDSCQGVNKDIPLFERKIEKVETDNDDLFVCDICGQCCLTMGDYDSHVQTHINDNTYYCHACECSFSDDRDKAQHNALHHGDMKKKFTCTVCSRWFETQGGFANHMKTCKSTTKYICKVCCKEYLSTGKGKFCCNLCQERISSLSDLKKRQKSVMVDINNLAPVTNVHIKKEVE